MQKLETFELHESTSSVASAHVQSKAEKEKEWRKQRRKSLEAGTIAAAIENKAQISEEATVEHCCPVALSSHVGFFNSPERAARAYDAAVRPIWLRGHATISKYA